MRSISNMALVAFLGWISSGPKCTEAAVQDRIDSGVVERAWRELRGAPWYDAERDQLRALPPPVRDPPPRSSRWRLRQAKPARNVSLRTGPSSWASWILPSVIAVLMAIVVSHAVWRYWRQGLNPGLGDPDDARVSHRSRTARLVELPFELPKAKRGLLHIADECFHKGDSELATKYLFAYVLLHLDERSFLRLERGVTNRMYLRELDKFPGLSTVVRPVMAAFEDSFFGGHTIPASRFALLRESIPLFQELTLGTNVDA